MIQDLNVKFLISKCVESTDLHTNFKINFSRFYLGDYYKIKTEEYLAYNFYITRFGKIIVANTDKGICYLHFVNDEDEAYSNFRSFFPDCELKREESLEHKIALNIINENKWPEILNIHVKGTDFQYKVWRGLTKIAFGQLTTYSELGKNINMEKAARAIGSAIGSNDIAYLIPCHRVIQKTGKISGFRWGDLLKYKLLKIELSEVVEK